MIDIWQGLEYVSGSEYASATQGSIENGPSYSSGSECARDCARDWDLKIRSILNILSSEYA